MSLLDKFEPFKRTIDELTAHYPDPTDTRIERLESPTEAIVGGRRTLLAGTNNYLGLTFEPDCIEAGQRALAEAGTGTTGSRMANGTYSGHLALERELAELYGYPYGMVFSTGYSANLGMLSALAGQGDAILLDGDAHASLYDGCRQTGADVYRFKHNDVDSLDKRLRRLGERATRTLVVIEGLYSMLGDWAPLKEIVEVKRRYGAWLMIDEAHSLGVIGDRGCGLVEEAGVLDDADFVVGTFSKSLGSTGGFCVSPHPELGYVRYASRPFIFTASPCPSVIATTRAALRHLRERPELRERLWANARRLYHALADMGFALGPQVSPVVAVRFTERDAALRSWHALLLDGVYTNLVLPPATPEGASLLRCSVSAAHSPEQIDAIIAAFRRLAQETPIAEDAGT